MQCTARTSSNGVLERDFTVGEVPGVLWSPADGAEPAPLVLINHGGGRDKKAPPVAGRAHLLVTRCGFHVAAIDAPGHAGRPRTAADEREVPVMQQAVATGGPVGYFGLNMGTAIGVPLTAADPRIKEVPRFEADSAVRFFARHLGKAETV
jgi:hypothetical protein